MKRSRLSKEQVEDSDDEPLPPIPESPMPEDLAVNPNEIEIVEKFDEIIVSL